MRLLILLLLLSSCNDMDSLFPGGRSLSSSLAFPIPFVGDNSTSSSPSKSPDIKTDATSQEIYKKLYSSVFKSKCLKCHKKEISETGVSDSWLHAGVKEEAIPSLTDLYLYVEDASMPRKADKLSDEEILLITRYILSLDNAQ